MSMIDRAKEKLRLIDYLVEVLGEPARVGTTLRWNTCLECGKSKNQSRKFRLTKDGQHFQCAKCDAKGDVIQAVQIYEGKASAADAARWVLYANDVPTCVTKYEADTAQDDRSEAMEQCLSILFDATKAVNNPDITQYLMNERKLFANVLVRAKNEGIIRCLPSNPKMAIQFLKETCGEDLLRKSGLWRPEAKAPGIAFRPLIFFFPDKKGAEFRIAKTATENEVKAIRYGVANLPWIWGGSRDDVWTLTEGAIDMLSIPCLTPSYKGGIVGIPGCNNMLSSWFSFFAGKTVYICFDNDLDDPDNPGQEWAKKAFHELRAANANPINMPPKMKDINKMLIERLRLDNLERN